MRRIEKVLAPLASLRVQRRYIVEGTKDEYLVPEEMLNSALSELSHQQLTPELASVHRLPCKRVILRRTYQRRSSFMNMPRGFKCGSLLTRI
jgi:hypothetical protein